MTNIKSSRKGTRLNDAQYFRLPLPHARKKMTMIQVMPRDSISDCLQHAAKSRDNRRTTVESRQSSVEIALVACRGFEDIEQNKERHRDVCVQTEVVEPPIGDSSSSLSPQVEDCREDSHQEIVREQSEKLREDQVRDEGCKIVDQKRNRDNRVEKIDEGEKKGNNWWRDGGQTILQFFAKILGKRGGTSAKGMTDRVLPGGKQRVKRVSRGGRSHNGHRRDVDRGGVRLKRVNNGYIVNHVCRNEGNGGDLVENKSREEKQHYPSILVRQVIQRTRDKNLRVVLLERELRSSRIVKENKTRLVPDEAVRQLSSPLC